MKICIVDASVVGVAYFMEDHADAAQKLFQSETQLLAPDFIYVEFANAVWKRRRKGQLNNLQSNNLLADMLRLPIDITPSAQLADSALQLAVETDRTVYDCLYLALAIQEKTVMLTADQRLVNALADGPLSKFVSSLAQLR